LNVWRIDTSSSPTQIVQSQQLDHADDQAVNSTVCPATENAQVPKVLRTMHSTSWKPVIIALAKQMK